MISHDKSSSTLTPGSGVAPSVAPGGVSLGAASPAVIRDFRLDDCNTFRLPAVSRYAVIVTDESDLCAVLGDTTFRDMPVRILGGGSNVLLREQFDGLTMVIRTPGIRLLEERAGAWIVEAAAGEVWNDIVAWTVGHGYPGLENLALIPGTVGAAPVQNIGAYGVELADRFDHLRAFDRHTGSFVRLGPADCRFGYRDSVFKHSADRYVVVSVAFNLPRPWRPVLSYGDLLTRMDGLAKDRGGVVDPATVMECVVAIRQEKLPDVAVIGNVGSFFHNPVVGQDVFARMAERFPGISGHRQSDGRVKLSAAWLIDQCGLKGVRDGPVGIYDRHALVLVNHGGATFDEVMAFAARVGRTVAERFGVELTREPLVI